MGGSMTLHNQRDWEAMPLMCELRQVNNPEPIFVNPLNVLYVRTGSPGTTNIYLTDEKTVVVAMPVSAVIAALDGAMNTPR
jgi:hypothetical protein